MQNISENGIFNAREIHGNVPLGHIIDSQSGSDEILLKLNSVYSMIEENSDMVKDIITTS